MGRLTSGIEGLDKLLEGGFPQGSAVLILGSPGSGKSTLAMSILCANLAAGRKCVYVTTSERPDTIRSKLRLFNPKVAENEENMAFLDCSSWSRYPIRRFGAITGLGTKVNELSEFFKQVLAQTGFKDGIILVDSLSDFLIYCDDEKAVFDLLQTVAREAKEFDSVGIVVMEEGVNTVQQVSEANLVADGVVEIDIRDNKRMLHLAKMREMTPPEDWIEFGMPKAAEVYVSVREFFK
jgi:circadian clock protein KaiC